VVIGATMLALNAAGTHYTNQDLPTGKLVVPKDAPLERAGKPHEDDSTEYWVVHVRKDDEQNPNVVPGRYLVAEDGTPAYRTDVPINRKRPKMDNDENAPEPFAAPQPQLFALLIEGILGGKLEWGLVVLGVLIALAMELAGVAALPFAVGMYLPLGASSPIFVGGMLRWLADRLRGKPVSEAESETSPGVLLSSGYIAGGTLCGLIIAFFVFLPKRFNDALDLSRFLGEEYTTKGAAGPKLVALVLFLILAAILLGVGARKTNNATTTDRETVERTEPEA
jgi:hypothetical protein